MHAAGSFSYIHFITHLQARVCVCVCVHSTSSSSYENPPSFLLTKILFLNVKLNESSFVRSLDPSSSAGCVNGMDILACMWWCGIGSIPFYEVFLSKLGNDIFAIPTK